MCVHQRAAALLGAQTAALCAEPVRPLRGTGGGSGGDPLSVMGQGHTMGALCQICWGCTAVGKRTALILVRMFTGVCHVWKLICSLTFPSHNHLRICISSLERKKNTEIKIYILYLNCLWLLGANLQSMLLTTDGHNIFVFAIVSPLYQR